MENVIKQLFMKKTSIIVIAIIGLVLITNVPPLKLILGSDDCRYSNYNGSFTFAETNFGGYDYDLCINRFTEYKKQRFTDITLYRLTPMNPLCFWKYGDYLFSGKYRLPYKPWQEIYNRRGPLGNKSGFQDF